MKTVIGVMRPPFLILGPACVFLGLAVVLHAGVVVAPLAVVLAFIGAIAAHAAVNAVNEYEDIRSGLDLQTTSTPFSGGSGTLRPQPEKAPVALYTGIGCLAVDVLIGIYFFLQRGWPILLIGGLGVLIIIIYTRWLNRSPLLCLIAPGLGFGTLMVLGTVFALGGQITLTAVVASFVPFFLVSDLLLLNQFPDADVDVKFNRRHVLIAIGKKASAVLYVVFLGCTYLSILLGVLLGLFPLWTLLGMATLLLAVPVSIRVIQKAEDLPALLPSLPMNVLLNILTPVLVGIGFLIH
jgi:1,4-dihydroxy-2-naphthoate octaprenyltransferase